MTSSPLSKHHVVHLTANLPGPLAAAHLAEVGISVTKIEPPEGDPFEKYEPDWYGELHKSQTIVRLDLKDPAQRQRMEELLASAQVFLSTLRPSSLKRLGLDSASLQSRFPKLQVVTIQGFPAPNEDVPAHDLTCLAPTGLLDPPHMPRTLIADFAAAERTFAMCLLALVRASAGADGAHEIVTLSEMAEAFSAPWKRKITTPQGTLGGGHPGYGIYRASDGWIALAALEPHFLEKLRGALGLESTDARDLARAFALEPVSRWISLAREIGIPLEKITS